jgi:iron complex outermembrane receptor protein
MKKITSLKITSFIGLCGAFSLGVQAQTGIDTLVVTGTRTNDLVAGAKLLNVDQQLPGGRADVAELLQGINGLQADSRSNYAQDTRITLRRFWCSLGLWRAWSGIAN